MKVVRFSSQILLKTFNPLKSEMNFPRYPPPPNCLPITVLIHKAICLIHPENIEPPFNYSLIISDSPSGITKNSENSEALSKNKKVSIEYVTVIETEMEQEEFNEISDSTQMSKLTGIYSHKMSSKGDNYVEVILAISPSRC